ncbi:MAG: twin-arginine translocation signal domain-containing protein, partial [Chloroflexi bacterium]
MQTRRDFIKTAAGVSSLMAFGGAVPGFLQHAANAAASTGEPNPVLVVIQLSGGNDGLNTVVPYEDDAYHRARPTLRLAKERVLKIDSNLGFHPDMPAFLRLYEQGLLSIVQGVGYPDSNRDHDAAKRDWHTARPHEVTAQTGWLGRAIDAAADSSRADAP